MVPTRAIIEKERKKVLLNSFVMMQFFTLTNFFSLRESNIFVKKNCVPCFIEGEFR